MNTYRKAHDPMLKRSPEPFKELRTIPSGWDLSELLPATAGPLKEQQAFELREQPKSEPPKLSA